MPRADFEFVLRLAEQHDALVLVDEIYRGLERDPDDTLPAACDLSPQGISLSSMSKIYGLPGLRLGWLATRNEGAGRALARLREYHNSTLSAPSEELAGLAIRHRHRLLADHRSLIAGNLEILDDFMIRQGNRMTWQHPTGGTIGFVRLAAGQSSDGLCSRLLLAERGILLPQSRYFDHGDSHFRIGYATRQLEPALAALDRAL